MIAHHCSERCTLLLRMFGDFSFSALTIQNYRPDPGISQYYVQSLQSLTNSMLATTSPYWAFSSSAALRPRRTNNIGGFWAHSFSTGHYTLNLGYGRYSILTAPSKSHLELLHSSVILQLQTRKIALAIRRGMPLRPRLTGATTSHARQ
jgi:hypothetical protein